MKLEGNTNVERLDLIRALTTIAVHGARSLTYDEIERLNRNFKELEKSLMEEVK